MTIRIIKSPISSTEVSSLAQETYKDMIKAVVDVEKKILALGGELHADAEAMLLDEGSKQENLWGINIYPAKSKDGRIVYTSFINIRPRQKNTSMELMDPGLRSRIKHIVDALIV